MQRLVSTQFHRERQSKFCPDGNLERYGIVGADFAQVHLDGGDTYKNKQKYINAAYIKGCQRD